MDDTSTRRVALVTGASSGIGLAFAHEYARAGYDLALTARREARLHAIADELAATHGCAVHVVAEDLSVPGASHRIYDALTARGLVVDALVNNAGYGTPGRFHQVPWERHREFIEVLVTAVCEMSYLALPGMRARKFGRIINVASIAGFAPAAIGSILYPAAKAFVIRFSQSLALENRGCGIHVTALCPGFTRTEFHEGEKTRRDVASLPKFMWMDAKTVAAQGFRAAERGDLRCINGWINHIVAAIGQHTPNTLAVWGTRKLMKP